MQPLALPTRVSAMGLAVALLVAACGGGAESPSPTRLTTLAPSAPAGSPLPTRTPVGVETPTSGPWPSGWQERFCALFADAVVMQELAVDIGRALEEEAEDDARALTAELAASEDSVREQLGDLPEWEAAAPFERQMAALLDLADQMATRYERYFENGRANPLNAARRAGGEMNEVVPRVLERVDALSRAGLSCADVDFMLEAPPEP